MKFSEFTTGMVLQSRPYRVEASEIVEFATRFDPQWFHTDAAQAHQGRWGGLIASGWHSCSIAMRLAVDTALVDSESYGSPGVDYIKWPAPLRAGESVQLHLHILEARRSSSGRVGVVRWQWFLKTPAGDTVVELVATSLFSPSQ
ncbi:MAG TPA: MaoC/PaaZ C-terminal domain-containing protein [Steroidobacteraceae bacterium]